MRLSTTSAWATRDENRFMTRTVCGPLFSDGHWNPTPLSGDERIRKSDEDENHNASGGDQNILVQWA